MKQMVFLYPQSKKTNPLDLYPDIQSLIRKLRLKPREDKQSFRHKAIPIT